MTMSDFEHDLRNALRAGSPPPGFAARTLERIAASASPGATPTLVAWVAGLVAVLLLAVGLVGDLDRAEQVRGEQAKDDVLLALRVAGATLNNVEQRIRDLGPLRARPEEN
jgi:hypothetical protein